MKKIYQRFCRVELTLAMLFLITSTFLIFLAAVMRTLGRPMNWSLEISMFIFAWCVFLSADVALREDRMVNLDLVVKRLPAKARLTLEIICYAIILVFLGVLVYYGFFLTWKTRVRTFHGIDFSYAWVTVSLPVASIFMGITSCLKIRNLYRRMVGVDTEDNAPPKRGDIDATI